MRMASMTSAVNLSRIALDRAHTLGFVALLQHVATHTVQHAQSAVGLCEQWAPTAVSRRDTRCGGDMACPPRRAML